MRGVQVIITNAIFMGVQLETWQQDIARATAMTCPGMGCEQHGCGDEDHLSSRELRVRRAVQRGDGGANHRRRADELLL